MPARKAPAPGCPGNGSCLARPNGLEASRRQGRVGGRRPVVDDDTRAAILARRERGEFIRTLAAGVGRSTGVVHKTLTQAPAATATAVPERGAAAQ
ncbi:helix-turn-helix domain-containing protein [Arthrobacter sp. M4]|uniref:helix-turn-helix domain-containing protein n=1 Tax=Arthrobacter sp. M4 TaxID=218160 RepID=UPI001CDBDA38|nr:hypothetical protein [Arthrobacter sp. M4]MCA4135660.1 hypothetical protein [Arthrobacter sp. M4]